MTNATSITIGTALTEKIKTVSGAGNAVFDLVPEFDLSQVKSLKIIIAPQSYARDNKTAANRRKPDETVKINIAVMQKCSSKANIPDLLALTEKIARGIEREVISTETATALITSVEFDPLYDAEAFRETKVFISVCTATIKVLKND